MALVWGSALALLTASASSQASNGWTTYAVKDGVTLSRRAVAGSTFLEYRAVTHLDAAPDTVLGAIWAGITADPGPTVRKRVVLKRSANEVLLYDDIRTPVVSDRDVVIRIRKVVRRSGSEIEVPFESQKDVGPPPGPERVRIPVVRGRWMLVSDPSGGTRLTYTCYSEPGGSVPAFMVRGAQQDQVLSDIRRMRSRLPTR